MNLMQGFVPVSLSGHRETVVGAWFGADMNTVFSFKGWSAD